VDYTKCIPLWTGVYLKNILCKVCLFFLDKMSLPPINRLVRRIRIVVECTPLERVRAGNRSKSSNLLSSAIRVSHKWDFFLVLFALNFKVTTMKNSTYFFTISVCSFLLHLSYYSFSYLSIYFFQFVSFSIVENSKSISDMQEMRRSKEKSELMETLQSMPH
jgi:hypothetical protein